MLVSKVAIDLEVFTYALDHLEIDVVQCRSTWDQTASKEAAWASEGLGG